MNLRRFLQKPYRWAATYSVILLLATSLVLLDTFVIPRESIPVTTLAPTAAASAATTTTAAAAEATTVITSDSYWDANIQITVETVRQYDTTIYIADVQVASADYLKTALANDTYGRNIKAATSIIAESHNAIFAVNGDYYGFRDYGFVLRNGILYRDQAKNSLSEALAIDSAGDFSIISESQTDGQTLLDEGFWQVLSFGPALVNNGEITVDTDDEVGKAMASNPRTAIGQISPLHYLFIVSDGRTAESEGLSLFQLAGLFAEYGCTVAYNLDGGGSSTIYLNGEVINNPTDGRSDDERSVSDIVYVGY